MTRIRSFNEIVLNLLDYFKSAQPNLDTKIGTVARDLFVDSQATTASLIYEELGSISDLQSFIIVSGTDLDKLAKNYGITRKTATPSSGTALLTFNSLVSTININKGDLVFSSSGISFAVTTGVSINPSFSNFYKSVRDKFANDLATIGIQDTYAIEITVQAAAAGTAGNIGKYGINRTSINNINNATNINVFSGGTNLEDDATFRDRILSIFRGSSIGTSLGYKNAALSVSGVSDVYVVEPNDPLMTRDGSVVQINNDGTYEILSEGSGGKVDIIILGSNLIANSDSFIYRDKSNTGNAYDPKNDFVLGQIAADSNKTVSRKRVDDIAAGTLPAQPVDSIIEVNGSLSGSNFIPKQIDEFGRVTGNYEIIKDTGIYAGSPWGFDRFHWISNLITGFQEDRIKGLTNGQDTLTFTDVSEIPNIVQNITILNENSNVSTSDRSIITLLHTPATNITRVFNLNTGERYLIVDQNLDGDSTINTTGRIKISGNTLPATSDVLQVDYNWIVNYDQYSDYDGKKFTSNSRVVNDSVDWGYSSLVRKENITVTKNTNNTFFIGKTSLPISSIINVKYNTKNYGYVSLVQTGVFAGRLQVILPNLTAPIDSINSINLFNSNKEYYNTSDNNSNISNFTTVIGITLYYTATIILPTDTLANVNDYVEVLSNPIDIYNISNSGGSFNNTDITIPIANLITNNNSINVDISYIANTNDLFSNSITLFPLSRSSNGFTTNSIIGFDNYNPSFIIRKENSLVQLNNSNEFYCELNLSNLEYNLVKENVLSVIRLSDNKELYNFDNIGNIEVNSVNNNYQIILNGYNTPAINEKVLVIYKSNEIRRFQPFTFNNSVINTKINNLSYDTTSNRFTVNAGSFTNENNISLQLLDNDGYIIATSINGIGTADLYGTYFDINCSINFNLYPGILYNKIRILNSIYRNNNGIFNIISFNNLTNTIRISNSLNNINLNQISITRIADGKELWSNLGLFDSTKNILSFPYNASNASIGDNVYITYFTNTNIKQSPTKLNVNVNDSILNSGTLTFSGSTLTKAENIVFTATSDGLKQSLLDAFKQALGLTSASNIPSSIKLAKVAKLEKVTTVSQVSNEVLSVDATYDLKYSFINDNTYYSNEFNSDKTLTNYEIRLVPTINNSINNITARNLPKRGDRIRITFYYINTNDSENINFTRNGAIYTNKTFVNINKVFIASGFTSTTSAKITFSTFTQPAANSRYKVFYNYIAPKQNERIIIKYNYNNLITDTTLTIENNRPINADVLVKQSNNLLVDTTMNIVLTSAAASSEALIKQNLKDKLISFINSNTLGGVIDSSDLINLAYSVNGIDRARIIYFNKNNETGQVLSITAQNNESFVANDIIVNVESR